MKLYSHQISPYARLCEIIAGICRIPLDVQYLDLIEKAEQKEEWFLKINPKHQIPVLSIDENTHLTESVVISQYLCRQAGHWGRAIYPTEDVLKTARIDEAITDAKNMKFLYFAMTKIMGLPESAEGLKECEDSMQALNDLRFKNGNTWMVGDKMTLADLVLATLLSFPVYAEYPMAEKFPNLMKGFNEIEKMPEWKKVNTVMMDFISAMKAKKAAK